MAVSIPGISAWMDSDLGRCVLLMLSDSQMSVANDKATGFEVVLDVGVVMPPGGGAGAVGVAEDGQQQVGLVEGERDAVVGQVGEMFRCWQVRVIRCRSAGAGRAPYRARHRSGFRVPRSTLA
jgi:hypothetical protein